MTTDTQTSGSQRVSIDSIIVEFECPNTHCGFADVFEVPVLELIEHGGAPECNMCGAATVPLDEAVVGEGDEG